MFNDTLIDGAHQYTLCQLKKIPFWSETYTAHPLPGLTELYISPINARQALVPPVTLNLMLISQFDNEPNAGKFVKDNVGMEGLDIEYNDAALFVIVATDVLLLVYVNAPELYDVGGVIAKGEAPYSLFTLLKLLKVGVPRLTSNVNVLLLAA